METDGAPFASKARGYFFLLIVIGILYFAISTFFSYLANVQKEVAAALLAAGATIIVSTLTVVVGRYYERKKEVDSLYRDKKAAIYDEFLERFFNSFHSNSDSELAQQEMVNYLREFMRKLLLWCGPDVIEHFVKFKLSLSPVTAKTIFSTEDFLLAIRKDLAHSNTGITKGFFANMFLQDGPLLLQLAKSNPTISLLEVDRIAKEIRSSVEQPEKAE